MPPKELETIYERIRASEVTQQTHEKEFDRMRIALSKVEEVAAEAKQLALQANLAIESLPGTVIKEIRESNRSKRLELRDWLGILVAIVACAAAIYR